MDECGDGIHDDEHDRRERVDAQRPVDFEIVDDDPGKERHPGVVMAKPDVDEGQPRQQHGGEQEYGGDDFGGTRSRGRRFDRLRLRGRAFEGGMRALRIRRAMRTALVDRAMGMVLDAHIRRSPGITGARAGKRDERGDNGAEKRQKDDRVIHSAFSPSSG